MVKDVIKDKYNIFINLIVPLNVYKVKFIKI